MDLLRFVSRHTANSAINQRYTGFWKLIRGILDPVVASKVHFINGAKDLEQLIPKEHIIKELGGEKDWEYEYVGPVANENEKLRDTDTRKTLLEERNKLGDELFRLTTEWISSPGQTADPSVKSSRDEVVKELRENYWKLDPYVRARTFMDRTGVIQGGGKIDFYADSKPKTQTNGDSKGPETNHVEQSGQVAA